MKEQFELVLSQLIIQKMSEAMAELSVTIQALAEAGANTAELIGIVGNGVSKSDIYDALIKDLCELAKKLADEKLEETIRISDAEVGMGDLMDEVNKILKK